jgi:hypothetical protein
MSERLSGWVKTNVFPHSRYADFPCRELADFLVLGAAWRGLHKDISGLMRDLLYIRILSDIRINNYRFVWWGIIDLHDITYSSLMMPWRWAYLFLLIKAINSRRSKISHLCMSNSFSWFRSPGRWAGDMIRYVLFGTQVGSRWRRQKINACSWSD